MNSEKSFMRVLLELGHNTVLGAALVAFGISSLLTPSLLTSVRTWEGISVVAIVLGACWSVMVIIHYWTSLEIVFFGRKGARFLVFSGLAVGSLGLIGTLTVASSWAANSAAIRYCTGKPDTNFVEKCKRAFEMS